MEQITILKNGLGLINLFGTLERIRDTIALLDKIKELMEQNVSHVILNLTEVTFITASFCGLLVGISKNMKERGIQFSIVISCDSQVHEIFDVIGFLGRQKVMEIYHSLKACLTMNKIQNEPAFLEAPVFN